VPEGSVPGPSSSPSSSHGTFAPQALPRRSASAGSGGPTRDHLAAMAAASDDAIRRANTNGHGFGLKGDARERDAMMTLASAAGPSTVMPHAPPPHAAASATMPTSTSSSSSSIPAGGDAPISSDQQRFQQALGSLFPDYLVPQHYPSFHHDPHAVVTAGMNGTSTMAGGVGGVSGEAAHEHDTFTWPTFRSPPQGDNGRRRKRAEADDGGDGDRGGGGVGEDVEGVDEDMGGDDHGQTKHEDDDDVDSRSGQGSSGGGGGDGGAGAGAVKRARLSPSSPPS
jgi:hypothetical protein